MADDLDGYPPEGVVLSRITIERKIMPDGEDLVWTASWTSDSAGVPLIEALGMIELARATIMEDRVETENG